jgi:hypothetical protein
VGTKDTTIQNFSADVHVAPEGTNAQNIDLTVPPLGSVKGAGTVSASNQLDFKMTADNIPFLIQGTTADPKFAPDLKGMASGLLKGTLGAGQKNPMKSVSGILKKKPN